MPRKTKLDLAIDRAIASQPFDLPRADGFAALPEEVQAGVAAAIARDKAGALSGNDLRAKYGEALTGPRRRSVLRRFALDSPATIARSYVAYADGDARKGSQHARLHGPHAGDRIAAQQAEADAAIKAAKPARKPRKAATRKPRKAA